MKNTGPKRWFARSRLQLIELEKRKRKRKRKKKSAKDFKKTGFMEQTCHPTQLLGHRSQKRSLPDLLAWREKQHAACSRHIEEHRAMGKLGKLGEIDLMQSKRSLAVPHTVFWYSKSSLAVRHTVF